VFFELHDPGKPAARVAIKPRTARFRGMSDGMLIEQVVRPAVEKPGRPGAMPRHGMPLPVKTDDPCRKGAVYARKPELPVLARTFMDRPEQRGAKTPVAEQVLRFPPETRFPIQ
jgi:hypothetical protein